MTSGPFIREASSFRDCSGYVFYKDQTVYRAINHSYQQEYNHLMNSGLYDLLIERNLLIPHVEADPLQFPELTGCFKIIQPQQILFISYPYEWCFEQLKQAALLTLEIQKTALSRGMILKDASAYNIQFQGTRPVLIDTLSFAMYKEGDTWAGYRQFCQHFVAVLALMKYLDCRMSSLLKSFIDGIPLDLASALLPIKSKLNISLLMHVHLQSKSIKKHENRGNQTIKQANVSKNSMIALTEHLTSTVKGLTYNSLKSDWSHYYDNTNYTEAGIHDKEETIKRFVEMSQPRLAWDIGANNGRFSRILSKMQIYTVSVDIDHEAVQQNFLFSKKEQSLHLLPLVLDITNPSPSIGWRNTERKKWDSRQKPDLILALALIHHLCFSHNLSFDGIAGYFSTICKRLIIEFVPPEDSQVRFLPKPNAEIAITYTSDAFEKTFFKYFDLEQKARVENSQREIYLLRSK